MSIPDLVIREIRARPVVAPLPRPIRTASGDVLDAPLLLIDVLTDAGVTGRAYAFAYTPLTLRSLAQFVRDIAPELIGKSVSPRARMRQMEKRLKLVGWQGFAGMVVGTLDMALWDALARAMDVPLVVLLGGEPRPLPAYDSFGMLDRRTDLPWLAGSVASGFKVIIEVGHVVTPTADSELGAKGAGEAGTAGAPGAVMNAIDDALRPLRAKPLTEMPFTPGRILAALGKV